MCSLLSSPLWPHIATTYLICTDGFLRVRPLAFQGRSLAIHWRQPSEYYTDGYRLKLTVQDEAESGQSRSVLIVPVGNYGRRRSEMSDVIIDRVAQRVRPQAIQRFTRGEPLAFGPFTVSLNGIQYKEQSFPWRNLGAAPSWSSHTDSPSFCVREMAGSSRSMTVYRFLTFTSSPR